MTFKIDELNILSDNPEEQNRVRKIFEILKEKAIKREKLSEHEKDFFSLGIKISILDDGKWEDYPCCDSYKFKELYLTYFRDLTGGSIYHKEKKQVYTKLEI